MEYKQYRRTQIAEMADWEPGFDMTDVSVSAADQQAGSPKLGDKIARNPANHADRWLVAAQYIADNFEAMDAPKKKLRAQFSTFVGTSAINAKHYYLELTDVDDYRSTWRFGFQYRQEAATCLTMLRELLEGSQWEIVDPSDLAEWEDCFDATEAFLGRERLYESDAMKARRLAEKDGD